jgi:peptidoglycan glycosyltransferase
MLRNKRDGLRVLLLTVLTALVALSSPLSAQASPPGGGSSKVKFGGLDLRKTEVSGKGLVAALDGGRTAELTLDAGLNAHLEKLLRQNNVPRAGVVALEPSTGRVLAYVSRDDGTFGSVDVARDASAPAASVFKLVSASALVDAGVGPEREVCYHGGLHGLTKADIEDSPRDHRCDPLKDAVARSLNAVFAKLSLKHLSEAALDARARAFGFGGKIPFDLPVAMSALDVPTKADDRLEFGRMSAGFFHTTMSPVHGAALAAAIANQGRMMRPYAVERVLTKAGEITHQARPEVLREVLSPKTARSVGKMMEGTVSSGTARSAFMDARGWPFLPDIRVAGKTGTLSDNKPYKGYTWWVGFAPADKPEIAVAALVVNTPLWRVKASEVAREALRYYLVEKPKRERKAKVAAPAATK